MDTTVRATCPNCRNVLRIPAQWVGQAVKCKKCGSVVRSRAKGEGDADPTEANGAAPVDTPTPNSPVPADNAFDFTKPSEDDDFFPLPEPVAPPEQADDRFDPTGGADVSTQPPAQPQPLPGMPGYGYPMPPGYPPPGAYGVPPGYPYAPPPGYPYPMPPGYPPPGYGYPMPPGYAPPAGYGVPPGYPYAPPPGAPGMPPAAMPPAAEPPAPPAPVPYPTPGQSAQPPAPLPKPPAPPAAKPAPLPKPPAPTKPQGAAGQGANAPKPGAASRPTPDPVPPSNEFKTDAPVAPAGRRYRRDTGKGKIVWVVVCLVLTGGLVAGGILGARHLNEKYAKEGKKDKDKDTHGDGKADTDKGSPNTTPVARGGQFPRRMLFIHISRYMYLNPLTYAEQRGSSLGEDRTKGTANRLAYEWQVPSDPKDPDRNQLFILSDTARPDNPRAIDTSNPMKNVVMGAYEQFFATSRAQDRIVVYFGGHALEKDGVAYIAPIEGDLEDIENTLIPLAEFYAKLQACKATQKVVIWDVCRFNPQRGKQRPGSEPMTEGLYKALAAAPPGVEVVTTCQPGENALEFYNLQTESDRNAPRYAGSMFLEAAKHVASKNIRGGKQPTPADPIPVADWSAAVAKRTAEMASSPVVNLKQTVKLDGKMKDAQVAFNAEESPAKRFEFQTAPKGVAGAEIANIAAEFTVPPIKPDVTDAGLSELAFRAEVMKDYMSDISLTDISKDPEKYRFQATTLKAIEKIRKMWVSTPGSAGGPQLREEFKAPVDDKLKKEIKNEQDFWAVGIAELELMNLDLDSLEGMRADQNKRWQANYDYARAVLKARLAFMNEYNKLLGDVLTETLPALDMKLGQDTYKLASSEKMKSKKDIQKLAEEAKEVFEKLVTDHKGTPWAIQAKRDKSFSLGLAWQPIASGTVTKD